ncbi:MAG: SusE domain-containing protein [Proteiniphilum sp.]|uniref:SusE domain-containing protein n=1 Tax=Proteiniphilum sp. TaxID=1926877 RepID=UPI002B1FDB58|nr:SusE domain-containing protein [Proteiniphilum sp.]MEA5128841.1 SusE domain-containing protein [Proteiniphilum sp.]
MKNHILFFAIMLSVFGWHSCADDPERPRLTISEIELLVPQNSASVDLDNVLHVAFAWEEAFLVDDYQLLFSKTESLEDPIVMDVPRTPYLITAADMNDIAGTLGVATGDNGNIYWSVQSKKITQPSVAGVNILNIKRLPPQPLTPARDSKIELDYETYDTEVKFTWDAMPDVDSYQLVISAESDLSNPLIDVAVNGTSRSITHQEFQDMINNPANGMKRFKANTLYWNVKAGDKMLASPAWKFSLYGAKIYTDVRGSESITYQVNVIPYDGKELIWMAENLRTTKLVDGTDLVYDEAGGGQESWNSQYFPADVAKISASTVVPEGVRAHAGAYYRVNKIGDNTSSLQWPDLLVPEGWGVPSVEDFLDLALAANKECNGLEVLRHPDGFPNLKSSGYALDETKMNLWNMNMVCCGTNRSVNNFYVAEFAALDGQHMVFATKSVSQCVTLEKRSTDGNARAIALGSNAPIAVRLIYIGDDK